MVYTNEVKFIFVLGNFHTSFKRLNNIIFESLKIGVKVELFTQK